MKPEKFAGTFSLWGAILTFVFFLSIPFYTARASPPYPDPPATYYGQILAGPGFTPMAGMSVTAWITECVCGMAQTQESGGAIVYAIHVEADWDVALGCGTPGREVRFEADTKPMKPAVLWGNSQLHEVNLSLADVVPPQVTGVFPADGAVTVARNQPLLVNFSEAMLTGTVTTYIMPTVLLTSTWSKGHTLLTLDHDDFAAGTRYTATVMGSDLTGTPMESSYTWAFTTGTEFAPEADLSLGKVRAGSGVVTAGNAITYIFTVTNYGSTSPVSATVVDSFNDATALAAVDGPGCVWPGAETVACTVTGIVVNAPSVLTMVVTTSALYSGTLSNSATVALAGAVVDPDAGNNNAGPVAVGIWAEKQGRDNVIYLPLVLRDFDGA